MLEPKRDFQRNIPCASGVSLRLLCTGCCASAAEREVRVRLKELPESGVERPQAVPEATERAICGCGYRGVALAGREGEGK